MVVCLVVIHCQNWVLVLPWLMGASFLCVKELAIEMHLWVYGCWCTAEEKGGVWNKLSIG